MFRNSGIKIITVECPEFVDACCMNQDINLTRGRRDNLGVRVESLLLLRAVSVPVPVVCSFLFSPLSKRHKSVAVTQNYGKKKEEALIHSPKLNGDIVSWKKPKPDDAQ